MIIELSKIQGLVFDLDGTIADTMPLHFEAWMHTTSTYGLDFSKQLHEEMAGKPTRAIVEIISKAQSVHVDDYDVFNEKKEKYFLDNLSQITVNKPIADIAYQLHKRFPMAIGTGGTRHIATQTVKYLGLDKYIPILVTSDDVENFKPDPDIFLKCAELMNVQPNRCLVFEDSINGIKAAENAGMMVVDVIKEKTFSIQNNSSF